MQAQSLSWRDQARLPGDLKLLLGAVMILSALVNLPRGIDFGVVSGLALVTMLFVALATFVWLVRGLIPRVVAGAVWPFVLLMGLGIASFVRRLPSEAGIQSLLILAAFISIILATGAGSYLHPSLWRYAGRLLGAGTVVAGGTYLGTILIWGLGNEEIYAARALALFLLIGMGWFIAATGSEGRRDRWIGVAVLVLIVLSLSRMALVAGFALIPLAVFRPRTLRGWLQLFVAVAAVSALLYLAITRFEPLRERFLEGVTEPVSVAGIEVSGSGRAAFWRITWQSYQESPALGHGPGTSQDLLQQLYPIAHPHNDYLRILHDYGAVGLALWAIGTLRLLWITWVARVRAQRGDPESRIHLAAFFGLLSLSITMIATNPWVFAFTMGPIAALVGCSLGRIRRSGKASAPRRAPEVRVPASRGA